MENRDREDLLLEIGCEELPPRFAEEALGQLQEGMTALAGEQRLGFDGIETGGTPRRLMLLVRGLATRQPPLERKVKGPPLERAYDPDGTPTGALHGFARSQGLPPEALVVERSKGVSYLFAVKELPGEGTAALLPGMLGRLLRGLSFSRPMYWERKEDRFPRPVRWLLALYGSASVDFTFAGVSAGRETFGHRFLSPGPFTVESAAGYFKCLEENRVILDPRRRRERIRQQLMEAAAALGGRPLIDQSLLREVAFLVEYPVAVSGSFARDYLELPREVLVTTMQAHQRYFPVLRGEGEALEPCFVGISNNLYHDNIRRGYEKVLRARLADARFFYDEDRRERLDHYAARLTAVIFHEDLGTMAEKQDRLVKLVRLIGERLGCPADRIRRAERAAGLCKADLVTQMVREFPELQGVMGRDYARLGGEEPETAAAIREHYLPRHSGDALPATVEGALLSLADRADTLSGCFAAGIQPTGSQDPYALRRQGQGIIAVLAAFRFALTPAELLDVALEEHLRTAPQSLSHRNRLREALHDFMARRLRFALLEEGRSYDVVDAVLAAPYISLAELRERAAALESHLRTDLLRDLCTAYNRVANLARRAGGGAIRLESLVEPAEEELHRSLLRVRPGLERALREGDYRACLEQLALLKEPVDRFFDRVLVMVEEEPLRQNRLNLLAAVKALFNRLADFSRLQGTD